MKSITQAIVALAIMVLASSCSSIPPEYVSRKTPGASGDGCLSSDVTTIKQPVSLTATLGGVAVLAAQHPEATLRIAKGTGRVVKGIFSAVAGENKVEPLPQRSEDSQGVFGYAENY